MLHRTTLAALLLAASLSFAADTIAPIPRVLPPAGVAIPAADTQKLELGLAKVSERIKALEAKKQSAELLADVRIYEKAVRYALQNDEFFKPKAAAPKPGQKAAPASDTPRGIATAHDLLKTASARLDALEKGLHPWTTAKGQVVRGYMSDVDGSPQPYGVEIPDDVDLNKPAPLMVWLHGRGDEETDLYFIKGREGKRGQVQPKGAIVVNVFGRQCVGYKSAGEVDVFDAIASVKKNYKIDENRIVLAGFSMGGAGAWHLGAHYTDTFCCVHTGAGFVDVKNYQKLTPEKMPSAVEQKLWGVYDVPDYVHNLFNVPMVSYSGEIDAQRASAELMSKIFKQEGHELPHLIGPGVPHKYEAKTLIEVVKLIEGHIAKGRNPNPQHVELQTRTLRYNKMYWVELTGLANHWEDTQVDAKALGDMIEVKTRNVAELRLHAPWDVTQSTSGPATVILDGTKLSLLRADFYSGKAIFSQVGGTWHIVKNPSAGLMKRHGLQGPIDDAFMAPFLFVAPTGPSISPAVQQWVDFEMKHQQTRWRTLMRGDLRMKKDTEVTPEDVQKYNLILWGDAKSNQWIAKTQEKLPARWNGNQLTFAGKSFDAANHVPALIFPNPLNPQKYVVLNSGLTFRENHDHTNSLQNPKLGDWAILDVKTPPNAALPAGIVENGFFDEAWQVKK